MSYFPKFMSNLRFTYSDFNPDLSILDLSTFFSSISKRKVPNFRYAFRKP